MKSPTIPSIFNLDDAKRALENIRSFFKSADDDGGVASVNGAGVLSFKGRKGTVKPESGDYTIDLIPGLKSALEGKASVSRSVNGQTLSGDVTITPASIGAETAGTSAAHAALTAAHGATGAVVGTTNAQTLTNKKFGGAVNYSEFEEDGTLKFSGDATVWKDVMFPMAPPKTTGAGNPTLVTYNGNMRGYSFAVNDVHDFDPQEITHDAKIGSTAYFHVHSLSRSNDGTDRGVKWEIEYDVEDTSGALAAPTVASFEFTVPAGTAVNTPFQTEIVSFTIPAIARLVGARIKRIASAGAAPSVDPVIRALHFHYEIDTVGSRGKVSK